MPKNHECKDKSERAVYKVLYDDIGNIYIAEMADGTVIDEELVDFAWAYYNQSEGGKKTKSET